MSKVSIFISHATPEDNDFVRWLAAKLDCAGYQVWHDLARLKVVLFFGIRSRTLSAAKPIVFWLVSKDLSGQAGGQGRVGIRFDLGKVHGWLCNSHSARQLRFLPLPISIHRKNVIDFCEGSHKGLANLLEHTVGCQHPQGLSTRSSRSQALAARMAKDVSCGRSKVNRSIQLGYASSPCPLHWKLRVF